MPVIYTEEFADGNSLFGSVYLYDYFDDGEDPIYIWTFHAEGVYVNGDGMLDKNPAFTGPFQDYSTAGIEFTNFGPETNGYWDATQDCIEAVYYPTTASLTENGGNTCQLINISADIVESIGVRVNLEDQTITIRHNNEGEHDYSVVVTGAVMPVAGQVYKVRLEWQCGTFEPVSEITAPDGFARLYINDELMYEAIEISLFLGYPWVYNVSPPNLVYGVSFGYAGLLGPLDHFTVSSSLCSVADTIRFRSGGTEFPVIWMEHTLRGA